MRIRLDHVSASEIGDYFQVLFEAEEDGDGAYVLIQRQFDDPDDRLCYVETHDTDYTGHFELARASLARSRFCLELRRTQVEVTFEATDQEYDDVARVMRIMIPSLEIAGT